MKYVIISKLAPGTDNARQALAVFQKVGVAPGTEATYASGDGKTFVSIVESDSPDMVTTYAFAPFFESTTVVPVVAVDEAWMTAVTTAQSHWD